MADAAWLSEAVVEFLKGPLYINPLMSFIDERCLIFTPEEENKLEYTICHNEFKELVDRLLTDFLRELGVSAEEFCRIVAEAQESDQLTSFVVSTILTVDDFLMFKAMMVRRNIDLTTQVLDAVNQAMFQEEPRDATEAAASAPLASQLGASTEEEEVLREALELSSRLHTEWAQSDALSRAMRALQLEDEEAALPAAIAASLREAAKFDSELADIEQAIALSLALDEERRRLASCGPAEGELASAPPRPSAASTSTTGALPPLKGVPSIGATSAPAAPHPSAAAAAAAAPAPAAAAAATVPPADGAAAAAPRNNRFVPAPIDAPTGTFGSRGRATGYRSDASGVDLEAIRKAAQQAAESQKKLIGKGDVNSEASKWLQEAKKKLVAANQADREQEIADYKAGGDKRGKTTGTAAGSGSGSDEAKRAALRESLAQKMRQNIMQQQQQQQ